MLVNIVNCCSNMALDVAENKIALSKFINLQSQRFLVTTCDDDGYVLLRCDGNDKNIDNALYTVCDEEDEVVQGVEDITRRISVTVRQLPPTSGSNVADNFKWRLISSNADHSLDSVYVSPKSAPDMTLDVTKETTTISCTNNNEVLLRGSRNNSVNQTWRLCPTARVMFPPLRPDELKRYTVPFDSIDTALSGVMEEHGFCVVTGVLTAEEVLEAERLWGEDLQAVLDSEACKEALASTGKDGTHTLSPGARAVLSELLDCSADQLPRLWPGTACDKFEFGCHSLAQGSFVWRLRLSGRARRVYEVLHGLGAAQVVVGMDTAFFSGRRAAPDTRDRVWGHADHNVWEPQVGDWRVYQSVLAVWPLLGGTHSTTVVWPGSHRTVFDTLMRAEDLSNKGQHVQIEQLYNSLGAAGARINERYLREARRVPLEAGSMIVWDSRTIHQGWNKGPRLAMPLCWEPRGRRDDAALSRKVALCLSGVPTTHWASLGRQHNISVERSRTPRALRVGDDDEEDNYPPLRGATAPWALREGAQWETEVLPLCTEYMAACAANQLNTSTEQSSLISKLKAFLKGEVLSSL